MNDLSFDKLLHTLTIKFKLSSRSFYNNNIEIII